MAGCEGCEVESVATLPLWHSQTVHLSACAPPPFPLSLACLFPLVLLSDCPVRFSFLTHAKLKMLTWSGHAAERGGGGAVRGGVGWGELTSFALCMNYKRHTFPARVAAPVPAPAPAPPAPPASLAARLLWLCSALLYAPFPFPLSTCWVFSVCPAQLSHPSPSQHSFLACNCCTCVLRLYCCCCRCDLDCRIGLQLPTSAATTAAAHLPIYSPPPHSPVPGHVFDKTTAWHAT